jgi:drug/metabolite transporter (DMT)-like permease
MATSSWRADLLLVLISFLWGSTFVLVKNALDDVSTILFLALRFSIAALVLGLVLLLRGGRNQRGGIWAGVLVGSLLYGGYLLQTLGLRETTPAKSGFLTGLYIVLVPVFAAIFYRRRPAAAEWAGVFIATGGMALMTLEPETIRMSVGALLTVGCAVLFAFHILALGHYSPRMSADWLSFLQIATCAGIALSTFPVLEQPTLRLSTAVWVAVGVTSLFATAFAFWGQTWAQARTTPTRAALIFSLEPVFAWLTSWAVGGEVFTARSIMGACLILSGVLLVELRPKRE